MDGRLLYRLGCSPSIHFNIITSLLLLLFCFILSLLYHLSYTYIDKVHWVSQPTSGQPSPRFFHTATVVTDNKTNNNSYFYLFGGISRFTSSTTNQTIQLSSDFYQYSVFLNEWKAIDIVGTTLKEELARFGHTAVYYRSNIDQSQHLIFFGGARYIYGEEALQMLNGCWDYCITNNTWTSVNAKGSQPSKYLYSSSLLLLLLLVLIGYSFLVVYNSFRSNMGTYCFSH